MDSDEVNHLKLSSEKEFREIAKGCGIKDRNKIPSREFKAMLGYRPFNNMMVEIRDEEGNCKIFDNMWRAAIENELSNSSIIKYAIDHGRSYVKRRWNKKEFFLSERFDDPLFVFYVKMDKTYVLEERCRAIFERLLNEKFKKARPSWLINHKWSFCLELDGYCKQLKLVCEYDGIQHYIYPRIKRNLIARDRGMRWRIGNARGMELLWSG